MSIVLQGSTSGSITLQEPAVAGSTVLDLPATSGTILTSATAISASSITTGTLPKAQLPTGSVLQVVQTVKTDTFSTTSTSLVDITGLSVTITPTSASNRILIILDVKGWAQNSMQGGLRLLRGSTGIYVGDTAGSRISVSASGFFGSGSPTNILNGAFAVYLDSPATTSSTTYKLQGYTNSNTLYINRSNADANDNDNARAASSITVMEIAA